MCLSNFSKIKFGKGQNKKHTKTFTPKYNIPVSKMTDEELKEIEKLNEEMEREMEEEFDDFITEDWAGIRENMYK